MAAGPEHRWLARLAGDWASETEMVDQPGEPASRHTGTEHVRMLGDYWAVCEARGEMPDGQSGTSVMSLGYDPDRGRFVGTFVGSMMAYMWIYDGALDEAGKVLTLEADGPSFTTARQMGKYKDQITFEGNDARVMTSSYLGDDGEWHLFMTSRYRRAT